MKKIILISKVTFLEIYKSKFILGTFVLALLIFISSFIAAEFSYGVPAKIALDIGLGLASLCGVGLAIFMGSILLSKEIENRTLHMVLSRPVKRVEFFLGRTFGLILMIILNMGILIFCSYFLYYLFGGEMDFVFVLNIFAMLVEISVLLLCVVFFSLFLNPTLSVMTSISIYILGHGLGPALELSFVKNRIWLLNLLTVVKNILPDFTILNYKNILTYEVNLNPLIITKSFSYAFLYGIFLIFLSVLIFEKKSLD